MDKLVKIIDKYLSKTSVNEVPFPRRKTEGVKLTKEEEFRWDLANAVLKELKIPGDGLEIHSILVELFEKMKVWHK